MHQTFYGGTYPNHWDVLCHTGDEITPSDCKSSASLTAVGSKLDVLGTVPGPAAFASGSASAFYKISTVKMGASLALIQFLGTGADNATFTAEIWAWRPIGPMPLPGATQTRQWTNVHICHIAGVLGLRTGVASGVFGTSYRYDQDCVITLDGALVTNVTKNWGGNATIDSDTPIAVMVDPMGSPWIEVEMKLGTATALNGLVTTLNRG